MSKVERIELFHVEVPLSKPFYPSWIPGYPQTHNRFTLIKLFSSDGAVGLGAGNAFTFERQGLGDLLGGFLLGIEVGDIDAVRQRLREASYLGWRNWWIETAYWDLWAKERGVPAYKLLGDTDETVTEAKVYASSGEVRDFTRRKPYLDQIREMGFTAVKIRVHSADEQTDMNIIRQVRREVGDDFLLAVDANQGWPVSLIDKTTIWDLARAERFGKFCDEMGVAWLEEPLDMHAYREMAELRTKIDTPIAGGELHGDVSELSCMLDYGSLDKYQPDCTFSGPSAARHVMAQCLRRGLDYSPHTWTNGLGFRINLHCYAAWPKRKLLEYPYEPPGWIPEFREGVIEPIQVRPDATVPVPQTPGFGIELDPARMRRYARRFAVVSPLRLAVKTVREKGLGTALDLMKKKQK